MPVGATLAGPSWVAGTAIEGWGATGAGTGVMGCLTGMNSGPFWPHPANMTSVAVILQTRAGRSGANMDFTIGIKIRITV